MERPVAKFAHTSGVARCSYTADGRYLISVGANMLLRKYSTTETDEEPLTLDRHIEGITCLALSENGIVTGSEDASVIYSDSNGKNDKDIFRSTLPIRDVAFDRNGQWVAIATDEQTVKLVNVQDMTQVKSLRHPKSVKHVTFHPSDNLLTTSCCDGIIYAWDLDAMDQPESRIEGIVSRVDKESYASIKAAWHPDGSAFAAPTSSHDIVVVSRDGWKQQVLFKNGHFGDITDVAWSPNGAYLATSGAGKVLIWSTRHQTIVARQDVGNIIHLSWHPTTNVISYASSEGRVYTWNSPLPSSDRPPFGLVLTSAPLLPPTNNEVDAPVVTNGKQGNEFMDDMASVDLQDFEDEGDADGSARDEENEVDSEMDDWIVNDGDRDATYTGLKRRNGYDRPSDSGGLGNGKRSRVIRQEHFQPGSTAWRNNRRYLAFNMIGVIWTMKQEDYNTVTVEFHDQESHRGYHFTDHYKFNKACLNEHAAVFSNKGNATSPSFISYRPNDSWAFKADWTVSLPPNESVTSLGLSDTHVVACTSKGYVRSFSVQGTPVGIYREKRPVLACATYRHFVFLLLKGQDELYYSIQDLCKNTVLQSNDIVALRDRSTVQNIFFSDKGDPALYDSEGVLLILSQWRLKGEAYWIPVLDTSLMQRRAGKTESYWPVAVADNQFICIILKGGETSPYFPRPLLSEFKFTIPLTNTILEDEPAASQLVLEESFVRSSLLFQLLGDKVGGDEDGANDLADSRQLQTMELSIDKALLQLMQLACKEERGARALELVKLLKRPSNLEAAAKIATYHRDVVGPILLDKIEELKYSRP